jgi:hypothetical protein
MSSPPAGFPPGFCYLQQVGFVLDNSPCCRVEPLPAAISGRWKCCKPVIRSLGPDRRRMIVIAGLANPAESKSTVLRIQTVIVI